MKFQTYVIPSGNAAGVEVPQDIVKSFNSGARPPVVVKINGHTWRTRIALMRGQILIGISAENRMASQIEIGDFIQVDISLDTEPRVVVEADDIAAALNSEISVRENFDRLPYGLRNKLIADIEKSKTPDTRARRIQKLIGDMAGH